MSFFAVPMEMRGSFLVLLLRLFLRPGLAGHHPQHQQGGGATGDQYCPSDPLLLGHAHHLQQNTRALFGALAEAEEQQTCLHDLAVPHRTRGLAGHHLGDYGPIWNRCKVLGHMDSWAVIMFVDFGPSATIPEQSLHSPDSDDF